jgi:hypothetical protein
MGKGARKSKPTPKVQPRSFRQRLLVPGLLGVAVVAAAATWFFILKPGPTSVAAQYQGGARLAIENDFIDFGNVRFEKFVTARFRLRNVGDQPLRLAANPPVEAVEGC